MSKYITFVEVESTGKTMIWEITNVQNGSVLGLIKWFPSFRKYAFFPYEGTVFDNACLNTIISFVDEQMNLRKKK